MQPSRVADILMEQGRQSAEAARAQGQIWGGMAERLGQIPGEAIAQNQQQKQQKMQTALGEQRLAYGAEELRNLQEERTDSDLTAKSVTANTSTDPETGHQVWNHQGVFDDLMKQGRSKAAERYLKFGAETEEHFGKIQTAHLAVEHAKGQMRRDVLGGIMDAPEAERPGLYATTMGTLSPFLKDDPVLKGLPPVYDAQAVKAAYEMHRTEAERLAAHKEAAEEYYKGLKETPAGGELGHVDPRTGAYTKLAQGAPDPSKGMVPIPPGGQVGRMNPVTGKLDILAEGGKPAGAEETERSHRAEEAHRLAEEAAERRRETETERYHREETAGKTGPAAQTKLEQQYRTVLTRAMSSRSGGIGSEDAKVQQANHLLALLHQTYDPKTNTHSVPKTLQGELAAGLARLVAPGGSVGIEMMREFNQRTAKGDLAGALTYITGQPVNSAPEAITKMLKDSIERQGKVAEENREGEMRYLRGLAPTELEEPRRQKLEKTSLNPLRLSRILRNPQTGERKQQISIDGGETWQ